jgi:NADH:ubiquinone oxidoreductase subunit E/NAD-dependent dihydropyrimidine dehydrogenase PreA subunit
MSDNGKKVGSVLVVGGGVAGMQAALDCANSGFKVYLLEKEPAIGGNMARLDKTFPTNDCAMCMISPKLVETGRHPNIEIISYSDLKRVQGEVGNFTVTVNRRSRYVDEEKCTGCGDCITNCMSRNKITVPYPFSVRDKTSPEVIETVDAIVAKYKDDPAGMVIGALQDVQNKFNYLRQDVMMYLSEKSEVPLSRLYAVARFYGAFSLEPRGENIIKVCLGTACHLKGGENIVSAITRKLGIDDGETTDDGMFTLERVHCLGACALAPIVTVNDKYYGEMSISRMMDVIDEQCKSSDSSEDAQTLEQPEHEEALV